MDSGFNISLEQTQKIVMTPELRQALRILQMPAKELTEYLAGQVEINPMLEIEGEELADQVDVVDVDDEVPVDWKEYFDDEESYRNIYSNMQEVSHSYDNIAAASPTLEEFLLSQLEIQKISGTYHKIGTFIIQSLDDNGYLRISKHEIAKILNIGRDCVSKALKIVQGFDPPGVAARSLRECLLIQLQKKGILNKTMKTVILEYLKELSHKKYKAIAKKLNTSINEIQDINDIIRKLEPKPGRMFSCNNNTRYIVPDVIVEKINNDYVVIVNDCYAPRIRISMYYRELLKKEPAYSNTFRYMNERLNAAMWVIKCIEQRRMTLYNVVKTIVDYQKAFLDEGIGELKPLNLRDVADILDIHESTVSRAISEKYVQTTRGIFELKYFFPGALKTNTGSNVSSQAIKRLIKEIIESEDEKKPVSDQKIAVELNNKGIEISRRTVSKYREEMSIASSGKRKRY